jgi:hypothetical protein
MGPGITHVGRVDSVGALVVRRTPMAGAGVSVALLIFRWAGFSPVVRQTPIKKQSENLPQTTRSPFPPVGRHLETFPHVQSGAAGWALKERPAPIPDAARWTPTRGHLNSP